METKIHFEKLSKNYILEKAVDVINLGIDQYWENWTVENLLYELPDKWDLSFAAMEENIIIGYIIASRKQNTVHLHRLVVGNTWRKYGIGSKLMLITTLKAKEMGATQITLKSYKDNEAANRMFSKYGFTIEREDTENLNFLSIPIDNLLSSFIDFQINEVVFH